MSEEWKDIVDYEGLYQISNYGNVRSLNYHMTGKPKLLKPRKNTGGYQQVGLYKDKKVKYMLVHRLVAEAFIPNTDNLSEVNHKSECPMLNFACVLEWCSSSYNKTYGSYPQMMADFFSKPIEQFDKNGQFIRRWKSTKEASSQLGMSCRNIYGCLKGRQKTAGGFVWRYAS